MDKHPCISSLHSALGCGCAALVASSSYLDFQNDGLEWEARQTLPPLNCFLPGVCHSNRKETTAGRWGKMAIFYIRTSPQGILDPGLIPPHVSLCFPNAILWLRTHICKCLHHTETHTQGFTPHWDSHSSIHTTLRLTLRCSHHIETHIQSRILLST